MQTESEIGGMWPRGTQGPPGAGRCKEGPSPGGFGGSAALLIP